MVAQDQSRCSSVLEKFPSGAKHFEFAVCTSVFGPDWAIQSSPWRWLTYENGLAPVIQGASCCKNGFALGAFHAGDNGSMPSNLRSSLSPLPRHLRHPIFCRQIVGNVAGLVARLGCLCHLHYQLMLDKKQNDLIGNLLKNNGALILKHFKICFVFCRRGLSLQYKLSPIHETK